MNSERFKADVAARLSLPVAEVFGQNQLLSEVLKKSPTAINSIDILEAFVGALTDQGINDDVGLPALTHTDSADAILELLVSKT
jgi:hypothetical protein